LIKIEENDLWKMGIVKKGDLLSIIDSIKKALFIDDVEK